MTVETPNLPSFQETAVADGPEPLSDFACRGKKSQAANASDDQKPGILVWHWGRVGAGPMFTFELARSLAGLGQADVSVSGPRGSDLHHYCDRPGGLEIDLVETFVGTAGTSRKGFPSIKGIIGLPKLWLAFGKILKRRKPDVVLCAFQSAWDIAALPRLRRFSGRFLLILHDASFHPGDEYPLRTRILHREIAAADGLIVLSDYVARVAQDRFGFPSNRVWTIPHGRFSFGNAAIAPRRHPGHREVRILFLGRIIAYKGVSLLIEAYSILRSKGVPVSLTIAGEGDLTPYDSSLAARPDIAVDNRWLSNAEMHDLLKYADIVVLPYIEASQSGVAAAAITEGLPVVVTPVGGLADQILHERTGIVSTCVSAVAVAEAINRLVADPGLYNRCSKYALEQAALELNWSSIAGRILTIVDEVIALPRRSCADLFSR